MTRIYVSVLALYVPEGKQLTRLCVSTALIAKYKVVPYRVLTDNYEKIYVDRILDIRHEASVKVGGLGVRYTCLVTVDDIQREMSI